jgi:threonine synthase
MKYISTRGSGKILNSAQAIISGIAEDGGLFVPAEIPKVSLDFISQLKGLSYEERAKRVLQCFLTDYTREEIEDCVTRAYGNGKFDSVKVAPLTIFDDVSVLELWHGPTSAFKDMALQLLPQLMRTALKKTGEKSQVLILVATSGDTGKAALEGFKDTEQIKILVFYPEGGVSQIQRLQMLTQQGSNVSVMAVRGNFDDAQSGVKEIFGNKEFNKVLCQENVKLSSANSINWGRLVPQIVYYFSAYADLLDAGRIQPGEKINFTVPTGNFGDILAGFYAKCMGLPVHKLICASNANNVLTDFLRTGIYDRKREFYKTVSPSMDILISSNLERLLYHMTQDTAMVDGWMRALGKTGRYEVGDAIRTKIQEIFWSDWANDATTKQEIKKVYMEKKYVLDTHTSVAWKVAESYQKQTCDQHPMVIISTASPYKFNESVLQALDVKTEGMDVFALLDKLSEYNTSKVPRGLDFLRTAKVQHTGICDKKQMQQEVASFSKK